MQNSIRHFLDELYIIEPHLKSKENEIVSIIDTMMKNRPHVSIDASLKKKIKEEILSTIVTREIPRAKQSDTYKNSLIQWLFPLSGIVFAFSLILVIFPTFYSPKDSNNSDLSFTRTIEQAGYKSFDRGANLESEVVQSSSVASPMAPNAKMMAVTSDMPLPQYEQPSQVVYVYTGELTLPTGDMAVYERQSWSFSSEDFGDIVSRFSFDWFDTRALKNTKISSLTLVEDSPLGYILNVDFAGWSLSLTENTETWPTPTCNQTSCESLPWVKMSDIPTDSTVIKVGQSFLSTYSIPLTNFASPTIDHSWKSWSTGDIGPETLTLTYPYLLDDKLIYEENGTPRWLSLTYNIRNNKISQLYWFSKESLKSSQYPIRQSKDTLMKLITQGGRYGWNNGTIWENTKTITIALNTPEIAYMRISQPTTEGKWTDFYVPALVFKVWDIPEWAYATPTITIPLIDEYMEIESVWTVMPYGGPEMMAR
jgi:hypothetical protein